VVYARGYLRLASESFDRLLVVDQRWPQDSHGNFVTERNAAGPVERTEGVTAEKHLELISTIKSQTQLTPFRLARGQPWR